MFCGTGKPFPPKEETILGGDESMSDVPGNLLVRVAKRQEGLKFDGGWHAQGYWLGHVLR